MKAKTKVKAKKKTAAKKKTSGLVWVKEVNKKFNATSQFIDIGNVTLEFFTLGSNKDGNLIWTVQEGKRKFLINFSNFKTFAKAKAAVEKHHAAIAKAKSCDEVTKIFGDVPTRTILRSKGRVPCK